MGTHSAGSNALFTAAFDRRIKAVVTSCGFTAFHHYYKGDLKGWTSDRYMPLIASKYENNPDKMPFDFHGVLAAIAPRAIYVCAPQRDANFEVKGVREVEEEVEKVYLLLKAKDRLVFDYPDEAHDFPEASRMKAYEWLKEQLRNGTMRKLGLFTARTRRACNPSRRSLGDLSWRLPRCPFFHGLSSGAGAARRRCTPTRVTRVASSTGEDRL